LVYQIGRYRSYKSLVLKSWRRKARHGFLKEAFGLKAWVMIKQKVQSSWRSRNKYERPSSKLRFARNHQNYWSLPSSFALQIPHMPMFWHSSLDIHDYPSYSYFGSWVPHGSSLYHRGLSPKYYAYWLICKSRNI
jgi:hypothetical protein